tara:strand:- start:32 stop:421 length:390 start_codon:yes stop_codon:yes gene_type:complete
MQTININTTKRCEFIDITSKVEKIVAGENIKEGICFVFCPHTTTALTINENADPSVREDILSHLEEMVPGNKRYLHGEGNSDGHIKSSMLGCSLNIIVEGASLVLGTWQGIYFCEFDGPRNRKIHIQVK